MEDENKVLEDAVKELKNTDEDKLKETISKWFESTRTSGMKIGATYISAAILGVMRKHINKPKASLRDYKRMSDEIMTILSVQLNTKQNDLKEVESDDGTAAESSESNS